MRGADSAPSGVGAADIEAQLDRMLASATFTRAWRDSRLLRYLVAAGSAACPRLLNEYAIGIDVFGRRPADYSPGEDPIVRVQLGRLRHRLEHYYSTEGRHDPVRFRLPLRSYALRIERHVTAAPCTLRLAVHLSATGGIEVVRDFVDGLRAELQHRLYGQLGAQFVDMPHCESAYGVPDMPRDCHVLECGVRTDGSNTRTTLRLLDPVRACVLWSCQVDHGMDLSIACQDRLAALCCAAVLDWSRG